MKHRRLNITIHGIEDTGSEAGDIKKVLEIAREVGMGEGEIGIGSSYRTGPEKGILIIKMTNWNEKQKLLERAKNLRNSDSYSMVNLRSDLTREQRQRRAELKTSLGEIAKTRNVILRESGQLGRHYAVVGKEDQLRLAFVKKRDYSQRDGPGTEEDVEGAKEAETHPAELTSQ